MSLSHCSDVELSVLATRLGDCLRCTDQRLTLAESCTGGWVAKVITDVAGSSQWFERGFVTYTDLSKQELLQVPATTLEVDGAVSAATVAAMARGALMHSAAQLSCAVSGIAGPGGGSAAKPVGLVWFAWALRDGAVRTEQHLFSGDREAVRRQAVAQALEGLLDVCTG